MFNYINLYVAIHDVTVFIIKVAVLMHEDVHSCLHLSSEQNVINFIVLCLCLLYIESLCPDNGPPPLPKPLLPALHFRNIPASIFSMSTIVHLL